MPGPHVFLSRSEPLGCDCNCWPARRAMEELLHQEGCEPVVVDRESLVPGQDWMAAISDGMGSAHGMLLIVSSHALRSEHVQNELAMAELRNRHDGFPVILLMLPEVTLDALEKSGLGSLSPHRRQMVEWPGKDDIEAVRHDIRPQLDLMRAESGGAKVHHRVVHHLREVDAQSLSRAGATLGVPLETLSPLMRHRLASGLLAERPGEPVADPLRAALTELLPLSAPDASRELVQLSVTHARVPVDEAARMRGVLRSGSPRVAVLPALSTDTARRYIHRASEQPLPWDHFVVPLTAGSGVLTDLVERIGEELLEEFDIHDEETLREHEHDFGPVVVIVPHPPDADLVRALDTAYPEGLLFLFVVDGELLGTAGPHTRLEGLPAWREEEMNRTVRRFVRRYGTPASN
ncbi:toll/interleukin-1 receptor domain-containing protein [Streptomyces griseorubiginosus]|uniref:toll/interleukin-1 receptor domain-containing protein n=1 Tax=Streptomyces griseorubiginosus TaxID=67304 RepID=UPI002E807B6D|nr:toll/interleukin-1 receptor domain-containing protein [Streptomyces griseorubiginosus]WUB45869.1 toll/interleukin-1 receptor domain-containing protein [Streptomyces griseorubiginosus]WUB54389.1 toll/interleukin-1 receptor domain-containing protein [Streptomyces griseorubiginosus]